MSKELSPAPWLPRLSSGAPVRGVARASLLAALLALSLAPLPRPASAQATATGDAVSMEKPAPLFNDLGTLHWPISTKSEQAQRYFNQGLILTYGFNHAEAHRSFMEVVKLDPDCPMGYWGASLVLGPNINAPMDTAVVAEAWDLCQKALARAGKATPKEKALCEALVRRYSADPPADRKPLDIAWANALRDVAGQFPADLDIQAMFVESLMDLSPWNYWTRDGQPQVHTREIVETLDRILAANPNHPGAIHFYIHALEASNTPEKAQPFADRLGALVPGSGHLVHMPSHIYIRTGRYRDAVDVNVKAAAADDSYLSQCHAQGVYQLGYVPHNHHMRFAAACLSGRRAEAMDAARDTDGRTAHELMRGPGLGTLQQYSMIPLFGLVRFGQWDEILATPAPAADLKYPTGLWHWARGMALASTGRVDQAAAELKELERFADMDTLDQVTIWETNTTRSLLQIGRELLAGEMAARKGDYNNAIKRFRKGVEMEDELRYNEPADWAPSVRHYLGQALLDAKLPKEAEKVYRDDLHRYPDNGWALYGLARSLEAQGKNAEAAEVDARFKTAWADADVQLTASRF